MGLEVLVIPVIIAVAAWILTTILRGEGSRPVRREPAALGAKSRPEGTTDLDRFLEEVNRRRRAADERRAPPAVEMPPAVEAPPPTPPVPRPRPAPTPPSIGRPAPRPAEVPPPAVVPVLVVGVVDDKSIASPPAVRDVPAIGAAPEPPSLQPATVAGNLRGLMRSRETIRTAVILQEILGPPRGRRRPR